jgi:precorrin-3B methylase
MDSSVKNQAFWPLTVGSDVQHRFCYISFTKFEMNWQICSEQCIFLCVGMFVIYLYYNHMSGSSHSLVLSADHNLKKISTYLPCCYFRFFKNNFVSLAVHAMASSYHEVL